MMSDSKLDSLTRALFSQIVEQKCAGNQVFICPQCGKRMEPLLLDIDEKGSQNVWWTCSAVKTKKCTYPLNLPKAVFWVKRTLAEREAGVVPPPKLHLLPVRYHSLYPALFKASRLASSVQSSRHTSREDSLESIPSSASYASSDVDDRNILEVRRKIQEMPKPRITLRPEYSSGTLPDVPSSQSNYAVNLLSLRYSRERKAELLSSNKLCGLGIVRGPTELPSSATVDAAVAKRSLAIGISYASLMASDHEVLSSSRTASGRKRRISAEAVDEEIDESEVNALVNQKLQKYKAMERERRRAEKVAREAREEAEREAREEAGRREHIMEVQPPQSSLLFDLPESILSFEEGFDVPLHNDIDLDSHFPHPDYDPFL